MNSEPSCQKTSCGVYVVALLGTFLIVGFLAHLMQAHTEAPGISATRGAERMQIMSEFKAANQPLVETYAWQDEAKGFVRIPIERAKELVLEEWSKDPVAARSNLMERAAKAFAVAPAPPPKKNPFE